MHKLLLSLTQILPCALAEMTEINRKYIDNMTRGTLVRVFWQNIEECYIREEYLFIFASDGEGTVIPARVLADGEFDKLYQFVMEQIDNHKP
ncbi:YcxB family protein [Providencia rettgeri]|nr:YcxB family protein [Providencia rettgeri]